MKRTNVMHEICGTIFSLMLYSYTLEGVAFCVKILCKNCKRKNDCSAFKFWFNLLRNGRDKLGEIISVIDEYASEVEKDG